MQKQAGKPVVESSPSDFKNAIPLIENYIVYREYTESIS